MGKQNQRKETSRSHSKHSQNNYQTHNKKIATKENKHSKGKDLAPITKSTNNKINKNSKDYKNDKKNKNNHNKVKDNGIKPRKQKKEIIDPMNPLKSLKKLTGNSAFKIMPEGLMNDDDSEDKFAALGEQQGEEIDEELNGQEYEGQEEYDGIEGEQEQEQIEDEGDEEGAEQYEDDDEDNQVDEDDQRDGEVEEQYIQGEEPKVEDEEESEQQLKFQEQQEQDNKNTDISVINLKIQQTLSVLMNVARLGQGKTRKHFIEKLKKYIHQYYGYNFQLIDHFLNFLNPMEMIQFFEANETQRPLTIRTNTLKTRRKDLAQALIQRGVNLDPLAEWSKVGIKIYETKVPIGATPEYLAGHYMLQSASSLLPVLALDPQMNEKILDMAAAPGGKTSYIAQMMKNTGCLFANDIKKQRLRALQFNLFRLGVNNTIVTCRDGRKYSKVFPNAFDRVLLDSPCTGLGIISKDMSIKANRMLIDIYKNSHVQKQLLLSAIDCTKVGGVIVYSTCSVSPLENQQVVNFALKKRFVKIVDMEQFVEVGEMGLTKFVEKRYHVDLKKTKRIYPHVHNMDGFYFAKLVKVAIGRKIEKKQVKEEEVQE